MMCPRCGNRITNVRLGCKKQIGWRQTLSLRCLQPISYYKESYSNLIKSLILCNKESYFM